MWSDIFSSDRLGTWPDRWTSPCDDSTPYDWLELVLLKDCIDRPLDILSADETRVCVHTGRQLFAVSFSEVTIPDNTFHAF